MLPRRKAAHCSELKIKLKYFLTSNNHCKGPLEARYTFLVCYGSIDLFPKMVTFCCPVCFCIISRLHCPPIVGGIHSITQIPVVQKSSNSGLTSWCIVCGCNKWRVSTASKIWLAKESPKFAYIYIYIYISVWVIVPHFLDFLVVQEQ